MNLMHFIKKYLLKIFICGGHLLSSILFQGKNIDIYRHICHPTFSYLHPDKLAFMLTDRPPTVKFHSGPEAFYSCLTTSAPRHNLRNAQKCRVRIWSMVRTKIQQKYNLHKCKFEGSRPSWAQSCGIRCTNVINGKHKYESTLFTNSVQKIWKYNLHKSKYEGSRPSWAQSCRIRCTQIQFTNLISNVHKNTKVQCT